MKRSNRIAAAGLALLCGILGVALMVTSDMAAQPRGGQWKKVEEAIAKGLPKTAIQELEPIIASALRDKAYPEAIKAIGKKIALEGNIEGNKLEEKITRMRAAIATAPAEMQPVMNAILAHWYWHYFQENRFRIVQRTSAGEASGNDVTAWDLSRILSEIDRQFDKVFAASTQLKAIPIGTYEILLDKGTIPDFYRPTLYDFIAFDALGFYSACEQAGAKTEDSFEIAADSPIFASLEEFLKWLPATTDAGSRTVKAIKLFQSLLSFHLVDADPSAKLDTDLHRLRFGLNKAVGEEKKANYTKALESFVAATGAREISAMARYQWAGTVKEMGDLVKARAIALVGQQAFPESPGGKLCFNLIQNIEAKSSSVTTERVWAEPFPDIRVTYSNIDKIYFRIVKADFIERLKTSRWRPEQLDENEQKAILLAKPQVEFSRDLPATTDFKEHTESVPIPRGLTPGFYYLISSRTQDFTATYNLVTYTDVWVSDLSIVTRSVNGSLEIGGLVLKAGSGEPVPGAKVQVWFRPGNGGWSPGEIGATDQNGMYHMPGRAQQSYLVIATKDGQQLSSAHDSWLYLQNGIKQILEQTVFFTDRSIYRPGQMIQFKGICLRATADDKYEVSANRDVTVVFNDVNGKEIAKLQARTNDYGSFSGTFTAPRDRLTGQMSLQSINGPQGATFVSVEEYKRPKFSVTVDAPTEPAKLAAEVKVPGSARSYSGVPIGGAKVTYKVVREVRFPIWYNEFYWWRPMPNRPAQPIAHGTVSTEMDGSFIIPFTARPDLTITEKDEPTFRYTITVDVTDSTGETRTGTKTIEVGYAALKVGVTLASWLPASEETKFPITTTTLDGLGKEAKGTLKVYQLKQPEAVLRPELDGQPHYRVGFVKPPKPDPARPSSWDLGEVAFSSDFTTDGKGKAELTAKLPAGIYRVLIESKDQFGKVVTSKSQFHVVDPTAEKLAIKIPDLVVARSWTVEPGSDFTLLWGTGYPSGRAYLEVEHRGKILQSSWTDAAKTQSLLKFPVTEAMRGGFTVRVTHVQENRAYLTTHHVDVPWTNKQFAVKWETFRSKIEPGKKEIFTAIVTGPDAKRAVAEMAAALYDQSLDAFRPHDWIHQFNVFRQDNSQLNSLFENLPKPLMTLRGQWPDLRKSVVLRYRGFPADVIEDLSGYEYFGKGGGEAWPVMGRGLRLPQGTYARMASPMAPGAMGGGMLQEDQKSLRKSTGAQDGAGSAPEETPTSPNLDGIAARTNLNETAFFFPKLMSDADGVVRMEFTMPEALTKWKFLGFVHDKDLKSGFLGGEVVTAKDLMAQPNPPRFLREGDQIEFPVKVSNQSATRQKGQVKLGFRDAQTDRNVDAELGLANITQEFDLPAGESKSLTWKITVPEGMGPLTFRAVAASERLSDGEEAVIPVLAKKVLVTESMSLPIRGPGSKEFDFVKLRESAGSNSIRNQSYTIQMASQPAWYAVMALPYLMEFPYECSEQTFNRLYANSLARHIGNSDPKIRRIFNLWKATPALESPLEKNLDLKSVFLEETPWVRQAVKEGQARKNIGILFDENRLNEETATLTRKLAEMQYNDGMWPWFPGGPPNDFITLYIATGYGRLRHLGVNVDTAPAVRATARLDAWADEQYRRILAQGKPNENHLSPTMAFYLYGRSFFLADRAVANEHRQAVEYWIEQGKKYWLQVANRQSQAHLALALKRFGDKQTPAGIMASIKERSVSNEEMGMFWRDLELQQFWFHAPIETQAVMIEAFDEVVNDAKAVEDCKVWLLKQKQTQDWKTTKATADAVYALLLRGDGLLKSDALVQVTIGNQVIVPDKVEAGTGFFEQKFLRNEINPSMSAIALKKSDPGVAWGSVHWQYLEDLDKVTAAHDGPLKLEKKLFKRTMTKVGAKLDPFNGSLAIGDEIVIRVVLRTDRDMEYVHLKDHRGSGTEPVNVLSRYRFQDGLAYYESTKDTATHFFIDYLPKGNYVFEYPLRIQLKGKYPTGFANIQCMYAPEFNSHSENITVDVK